MLFQSLNTQPEFDSSIFLSCRNILTDFQIWPISKSPVLGFCIRALNHVTWCWREEDTLDAVLPDSASGGIKVCPLLMAILNDPLLLATLLMSFFQILESNLFHMTKGCLPLNICLISKLYAFIQNTFYLSLMGCNLPQKPNTLQFLIWTMDA